MTTKAQEYDETLKTYRDSFLRYFENDNSWQSVMLQEQLENMFLELSTIIIWDELEKESH